VASMYLPLHALYVYLRRGRSDATAHTPWLDVGHFPLLEGVFSDDHSFHSIASSIFVRPRPPPSVFPLRSGGGPCSRCRSSSVAARTVVPAVIPAADNGIPSPGCIALTFVMHTIRHTAHAQSDDVLYECHLFTAKPHVSQGTDEVGVSLVEVPALMAALLQVATYSASLAFAQRIAAVAVVVTVAIVVGRSHDG